MIKKCTGYCPKCRKRTPQVKDEDEKLCLKCGYKEKRESIWDFN